MDASAFGASLRLQPEARFRVACGLMSVRVGARRLWAGRGTTPPRGNGAASAREGEGTCVPHHHQPPLPPHKGGEGTRVEILLCVSGVCA